MSVRVKTVLVADDDTTVRAFIAAALERQGYAVLLAPDADAAIEFANDEGIPIDVLVTDITMPGRSGIELAGEVRAVRPTMGVVLMSGWRLDQPVHGIPGQAVELLEKPFDLSSLAEAVERALGQRMAQ
jgi:DNA-binding NtrC family response regulator